KGDTLAVEGDEPAVGDGDPMGVAGQIGEHRVGPANDDSAYCPLSRSWNRDLLPLPPVVSADSHSPARRTHKRGKPSSCDHRGGRGTVDSPMDVRPERLSVFFSRATTDRP